MSHVSPPSNIFAATMKTSTRALPRKSLPRHINSYNCVQYSNPDQAIPILIKSPTDLPHPLTSNPPLNAIVATSKPVSTPSTPSSPNLHHLIRRWQTQHLPSPLLLPDSQLSHLLHKRMVRSRIHHALNLSLTDVPLFIFTLFLNA